MEAKKLKEWFFRVTTMGKTKWASNRVHEKIEMICND
jgi:hypothetical protein